MAEIFNLRQKRKARDRSEKDKHAAGNRQKHGRTREQKEREKLEAERAKKLLDGHKIEPDDATP